MTLQTSPCKANWGPVQYNIIDAIDRTDQEINHSPSEVRQDESGCVCAIEGDKGYSRLSLRLIDVLVLIRRKGAVQESNSSSIQAK